MFRKKKLVYNIHALGRNKYLNVLSIAHNLLLSYFPLCMPIKINDNYAMVTFFGMGSPFENCWNNMSACRGRGRETS